MRASIDAKFVHGMLANGILDRSSRWTRGIEMNVHPDMLQTDDVCNFTYLVGIHGGQNTYLCCYYADKHFALNREIQPAIIFALSIELKY